jgi:hypothetical protein
MESTGPAIEDGSTSPWVIGVPTLSRVDVAVSSVDGNAT